MSTSGKGLRSNQSIMIAPANTSKNSKIAKIVSFMLILTTFFCTLAAKTVPEQMFSAQINYTRTLSKHFLLIIWTHFYLSVNGHCLMKLRTEFIETLRK